MSSAIAEPEIDPWRRRLYLPAYRVSDAARYAGVAVQTVSYWQRGDGTRRPTLSMRPRRHDLSYYQLVEVAFVATFRSLGVPLQRIRKARDYAAQVLKSEYPFADYEWQTEGRHLLLDLRQLEPDASLGNLVVADAQGQVAWEQLVSERFEQFEYEQGLALLWHVSGRNNPVVIDPRVSFGAPTVKGIPTWSLKGRWDAGESIADLRDDFGLSKEEIEYGLQFEGVSLGA